MSDRHGISNVKMAFFRKAFEEARENQPLIAAATSPFQAGQRGTRYYLGSNGWSDWGYAIRADGELVYVFSTSRGKGDAIVESAIANGAVYLDCFDGYLVDLYSRHGFDVAGRVPNWTPGQPDVVYMNLTGYESRHGLHAKDLA